MLLFFNFKRTLLSDIFVYGKIKSSLLSPPSIMNCIKRFKYVTHQFIYNNTYFTYFSNVTCLHGRWQDVTNVQWQCGVWHDL